VKKLLKLESLDRTILHLALSHLEDDYKKAAELSTCELAPMISALVERVYQSGSVWLGDEDE
jgi:hypothetical protein